jgi:hypothetical protein
MSVVKAIIGLIRIMGRTFVRNNNPGSPISSIQQGLLNIKIGFDNKDPLNPTLFFESICTCNHVKPN